MARLGRLVAVLLVLAALIAPSSGKAATLLRDAEIEATLREIADPIFEAAGLDPGSVRLFIVNERSLNAFVAGGQNLFLHAGLLSRSETPEQVAGVIAHEAGHIAGGHLSRLSRAQESASGEALVGALLGAAAAVAGAPQLGTAMMMGGATMAQRGLLKFSRNQEQAADQAAIRYLEALGLPPKGLLEFFKILEDQSLRISSQGGEFLRTHPLTSNRIRFLANQVERSPHRGRRLGEEMDERHARMVAKLEGFLADPDDVIRSFAGDSLPDRYARAVASFRRAETGRALDLIDGLLEERPDDPYIHELKGQILFESGRVGEAVAPYRRALEGRPDSALIRFGLARALIERGESEADLEEAASLLGETTRLEPQNATAWRFFGIAQGRLGHKAEAALALAEHAILTRNREDAELYLRRAEQHVEPGSPDALQLEDLRRALDRLERR